MEKKYRGFVKRNRRGEWYWIVKCVNNGKTIAKSSESYHNFDDCVVFLDDMKIEFGDAEEKTVSST